MVRMTADSEDFSATFEHADISRIDCFALRQTGWKTNGLRLVFILTIGVSCIHLCVTFMVAGPFAHQRERVISSQR